MNFKTVLFLFGGLTGALCGAEQNLYTNPGFETWNEKDNLPSVAWRWSLPKNKQKAFECFERTDREKHSGNYSLHLKDSDKGPVNHTLAFIIGGKEAKQRKLGGKILHFSAWVKQVSASRARVVGIGLYAVGENKKILTASATVDSSGPTDWGKLQTKLKLPESPSLIFASLWCANGFNNTGEAYFDDIVLSVSPPQGGSAVAAPPRPTAEQPKKEIAPGTPWISFHPAPQSWKYRTWGGFRFKDSPSATRDLHLKMTAPTNRWGGISIGTNLLDRQYDLSALPEDKLSVNFLLSRNVPVQIGLEGRKKITLPRGIKTEKGLFRYQIPFKAFSSVDGKKVLSGISLQFPESLPPGDLMISGLAVHTAQKAAAPRFSVSPEVEKYRKECELPKVVTNDRHTRPEIRNGTWYFKGKPQYYLGPWIYNRNTTDWHKNANPLKIDHIGYKIGPCKEVFDFMGFNSAQISAAHTQPGIALYGLPIPSNFRKTEQDIADYFKGFREIPMVLDFAFGYHEALRADNPRKYKELDQRNGGWHAFIPFCPEHPEGDRYYRNYFLGGVRAALKNSSNVFVYELFNESAYNCQCRFNAREFANRMKKQYGTIQKANKTWDTIFDSFDEVAQVTNFQQYRKLWPDWCKFSAQRYAEILRKYTKLIRSVDKRPNVYFTEQAAGKPPAHTGMDYRRIAESLDVLAIEGGWLYGFESNLTARNEMEAVVVSGGSSHWFNCDFYQALAKGKKPVINNEHYCTRVEQGIRVPSRKEDMITSLWTEIMHGVSSNYTYVWDKRSYDWKTFEQAKANVIKPSYKSSSMLNPYNWPVSELKAFKLFEQELEPYKERILPFPRTQKARVALFYSYPTLRMTPFLKYKFGKRMEEWYAALLHAQIPLKVVFEEELEAGLESEIQALVFPAADYVSPETLRNVEKFRKRGGIVIAERNAFRMNEHSNLLPETKGIFRLNADETDKLPELLLSKGIERYGTIVPADSGKPIAMSDLQIVDRGDFKFVFLVAMGEITSRLAEIRLNFNDSGTFYLYDILGKRILKNGTSEQWSAAELKRGFQWILPSQERVLFTLERKRPAGAGTITRQEIAEQFRKTRKSEEKTVARFRARQAQLRKEYEEARIWRGVNGSKCVPLDLRKAVNMHFRDEVAGDKKGGWFDQGGNDFANMPLGRRIFAGVPFEIISPDRNNGKGVVILYGTPRDYFPKEVCGIPIGRKAAKLYFLHTMGWDSDGKVMTYRIHYADGSITDVPVMGKRDIGGWWGADPLPNAKIAVETSNAEKDLVNMQCFRWINPHPEKEIRSLDLISAQTEAVPAIAAVTLEMP